MSKQNYHQQQYWQSKYKTTNCESYQWICKPQLIIQKLSNYLNFKQLSTILQIGCGASAFGIKLKKYVQNQQGNQISITYVDFSKQLIKKCREGKIGGSGSTFICADVRDMKSIQSDKFDLILDKSTTDCLFCFDNFIKEVLKAMRQCYRVLKQGGKMIILTHAKPKFRKYLFRNKLVPFIVQTEIIKPNKDSEVYAYICTKVAIENTRAEQQQDGRVLSEHQVSQHEQEQKQNKSDIKIQQQQQQEVKKGFIEENRQKRKNNKKKGDEQPHFILSEENENNLVDDQENKIHGLDDQPQVVQIEQNNEIDENTERLKNASIQKKNKNNKKDDEAHFILSLGDEEQNQSQIKMDQAKHQIDFDYQY